MGSLCYLTVMESSEICLKCQTTSNVAAWKWSSQYSAFSFFRMCFCTKHDIVSPLQYDMNLWEVAFLITTVKCNITFMLIIFLQYIGQGKLCLKVFFYSGDSDITGHFLPSHLPRSAHSLAALSYRQWTFNTGHIKKARNVLGIKKPRVKLIPQAGFPTCLDRYDRSCASTRSEV